MHFVYMVKCNDGSFYTGYATRDVDRRVREHNESTKGAKYTSGRRPVELCYVLECESKSEALRMERVVRKLTRTEKEELVGLRVMIKRESNDD